MCPHLRRICRAGANLSDEVAGNDRAAGLCNRGVATGVIGVRVRGDDVTNRLAGGELPDLGQDLVGVRRGCGIDHEHTIVTNLDCDI